VEELLDSCIELTRQAGEAVMEIYDSGDFDVKLKSDNTPLTKADLTANRIIVDGLQELSELPIISEESSHDAHGSSRFWLVDPIDGTKEFLDRNGFFTINIGLITDGEPVLGVVYAPAKGLLYAAARGSGAFKVEQDGDRQPITAKFSGKIPVVVASRSHRDERMNGFLQKLGKHTEINIGSSLKLCLVAEGAASVYPRFAPTSLWDTAAADAVLREAGGTITTPEGETLVYDPEQTLLNPFFVARVAD
jgi:3'(2'), 5'-bisphosphate nucleotidase